MCGASRDSDSRRRLRVLILSGVMVILLYAKSRRRADPGAYFVFGMWMSFFVLSLLVQVLAFSALKGCGRGIQRRSQYAICMVLKRIAPRGSCGMLFYLYNRPQILFDVLQVTLMWSGMLMKESVVCFIEGGRRTLIVLSTWLVFRK